jgi:hypothetical protein
MKRSLLVPLVSALLLAAAPAQASDDVPDDIHAGYVVGGVLVGTGLATGVVGFTQWAGLSTVQDQIYHGGTARAQLDLLIEEGNDYMLRGIIFSSIAGVGLVSGIITLATTSDRHEKWKRENASLLLHRRSPWLASVALAPDRRGGLSAALEVRW